MVPILRPVARTRLPLFGKPGSVMVIPLFCNTWRDLLSSVIDRNRCRDTGVVNTSDTTRPSISSRLSCLVPG